MAVMVRVLIVLALLSGALLAQPVGQGPAAREVLIKWRSLPSQLDACDLLPEFAVDVESLSPTLPVSSPTAAGLERITTVRMTTVEAADLLVNALQADPRVEYAERRPIYGLDGAPAPPGRRGALDGVPNDPFYSQQWGLRAIDAEAAWDITRGDPAIAIAVVDLGVDFTNPELAPARWENEPEVHGLPGVDDDGNGYVDDLYGWDFVDEDGEPLPDPRNGWESHGTHVAGLAAAARNNGIGIAGLAPDCKIMGVRAGHTTSIDYGYDAVYYACRSGARVINCSWGGDSPTPFGHDILSYVSEHGCVVVASAGNSGTFFPHYPAAVEGVIGVAATQIGDLAAQFTQYGPWVKISAPGVAMLSVIVTDSGGFGYGLWQGTSMAAPMVAAACGLVASRWPQMDGRTIAARVICSADPIDGLNPQQAGMLGLGRLNAWRALADSVQGVRLGTVTYTETVGNGDGRIRGGEQAQLLIPIYNDLEPISSVAANIAVSGLGVTLLSPVCLYGSVPVGGPFLNTTPVNIELAAGLERGPAISISVDWLGPQNRLVGRSTAEVQLDSTFVVVDNGQLSLGFAENGCLGYSDYVNGLYLGPGFRITDHTNALYHGSFLVAADEAVSDNAYGDASFSRFDWVTMPDSVAHLVPSGRADVEAVAAFEDRQAERPLFVRVESAALAWRGETENQFLILEYRVTNRSVNTWSETFCGFFLDWDLASADGNIAAFDTTMGIAYIRQIAPGHPLAGIVPITDSWGAFRVVDNRLEIDPPADWSDGRKWTLLQAGIGYCPVEPKDISLLAAVGPDSFSAHETRTYAFALVTGSTLADLRAQAEAAFQHYAVRKTVRPLSSAASEIQPLLSPNPLSPGEALRLVLPMGETADLRFYNILGRQVAEMPGVIGGPQGIVLDRSRLSSVSGLLLYRLESRSRRVTGKLLILR